MYIYRRELKKQNNRESTNKIKRKHGKGQKGKRRNNKREKKRNNRRIIGSLPKEEGV